MIITISGTPGSGKSTVAKMLVQKLGLERINIGAIMRQLAQQKEMTLEKLTAYAKNHPEIDREVDHKTRDQARVLAQKGKNVLVEGRVQFFFLPESIKIFLKVDFEEAAKRILKDLQNAEKRRERNEEVVLSLPKVKEKIIRREEEDAQRYKKLYGLDHRDEKQYDLIINTTSLTPEKAVEKILSYLKTQSKSFA